MTAPVTTFPAFFVSADWSKDARTAAGRKPAPARLALVLHAPVPEHLVQDGSCPRLQVLLREQLPKDPDRVLRGPCAFAAVAFSGPRFIAPISIDFTSPAHPRHRIALAAPPPDYRRPDLPSAARNRPELACPHAGARARAAAPPDRTHAATPIGPTPNPVRSATCPALSPHAPDPASLAAPPSEATRTARERRRPRRTAPTSPATLHAHPSNCGTREPASREPRPPR